MSTRLLIVDQTAVGRYWPLIRHWVMSASGRAKELDEFTIVGRLLLGEMYLFVVEEQERIWGALTVELQTYPLRTVAQIVHLGSDDLKVMQEHLGELTEWARRNGASALRLHGRKGFARRLRDLGFSVKYMVMEKEI